MRFIFLSLLCCHPLIGSSQSIVSPVNDLALHSFGFYTALNLPQQNGRLGSSMGLLYEFSPIEQLYLGMNANLSFIHTRFRNHTLQSPLFELPIYLLYRPFKQNVSPVIFSGLALKTDLLSLAPYVQGELGLGVDLRLTYFTVRPNVKYSFGNDLNIYYFSLVFK